MRISIDNIKETIAKLEEIVAEMEDKGLNEVRTEGNTYFCGSNFISYGYDGFLDLDSTIEHLYNYNESVEE